jgi:hypothetical protein
VRRARHRPPGIAADYGSRLARRISGALLLALALLWTSGAAWMLLHWFGAHAGEFGIERHPLEAPTLTLHGVLAMPALFLLGWFAGRHAAPVASGQRAASGWWLTAWLAVLVVAGLALLFVGNPAWQSAASLVHQVLGATLLLPVLAHAWRFSLRARGPADGHAHGRDHRQARHSARS